MQKLGLSKPNLVVHNKDGSRYDFYNAVITDYDVNSLYAGTLLTPKFTFVIPPPQYSRRGDTLVITGAGKELDRHTERALEWAKDQGIATYSTSLIKDDGDCEVRINFPNHEEASLALLALA